MQHYGADADLEKPEWREDLACYCLFFQLGLRRPHWLQF
jgi:hypothetical protein